VTEHHQTPKPRRHQAQSWVKILQNPLQAHHSMFFKRKKIKFTAIDLTQLMLTPGLALDRGSLATS